MTVFQGLHHLAEYSQRQGQDVKPKVKQFAMTLETRKVKLKTKGKTLNYGQSRVK